MNITSTKLFILLSFFIVTFHFNSHAQEDVAGTIKGTVLDQSNNRPVEFVNVILRKEGDTSIVTGKVTDKTGKFELSPIQPGKYLLTFRLIGYKEKSTALFLIDAQHKHLNVGEIALTATTVNLDEVLVTGQKSMYNNTFDKKVYNVDQDLMSKSGSVSELLQNVPSVTVDIDGNVALRGSTNVLIMVDGKSSPLLKVNSAEVLQEMPANSIEKIEVMTNPSAKYRPDGTSGIINIVTKKNTVLGLNGDVSGNVGNQTRYNGSLRLNYSPGMFNLYGSYAIRKDRRNRFTDDNRWQIDSTNTTTLYNQTLSSFAAPLSHTVNLGFDVDIDTANTFGASGNYFYNGFTRTEFSTQALQSLDYNTLNQYIRNRIDYEYEKEYGMKSYFEHIFTNKDNNLRLEYTLSHSPEQEDNHYTNIYTVPDSSNSYDNTLITNGDNENEITLDYTNQLNPDTKIEAGYAGEFNSYDYNYIVSNFDATQDIFVADLGKTNHFNYDENFNAVYATYSQSFGVFGVEGGLRIENASVKSNLVTLDSTIVNNYFNLYPTLHLSYKVNPASELQLSYSRRTHRPETEDLNPFPEYRDPRNLREGNPKLQPEYIHSLEFGCQFDYDEVTLLPALFYRLTYNRFTVVTQLLNDTLTLTTHDNLSKDQSGGLELVASADFGDMFTAHWNATVFREQIDATNLGFSDMKSTTSWTSTLTVAMSLTPTTRFQLNANYNSARLTPQGQFTPSYVVNSGIRQDFLSSKLSCVLTIADIFNTLKRHLDLATPLLNETTVNTRDTRIIYLGFTYHFGSSPKKMKEEQFKYDDNF